MKNISALMAIFAISVALAGAPNSGDCIPDGPGWDANNPVPGEVNGVGPAPNSGDGIPDGSGF